MAHSRMILEQWLPDSSFSESVIGRMTRTSGAHTTWPGGKVPVWFDPAVGQHDPTLGTHKKSLYPFGRSNVCISSTQRVPGVRASIPLAEVH